VEIKETCTEKEYEDTSELMFLGTARGKKGDFIVCVSSILLDIALRKFWTLL